MFMWGHTYLALLSAIVVACAMLKTGSVSLRHLRDARLRFIGSISYSLYLFHPCIFGAVILLLGRKPVVDSLDDWLMVLGALVISILVCAASLRLVEGPLIAFGRRFRY
jgi:peptidoglycan/LPS O-acetylase OafA/YrhL